MNFSKKINGERWSLSQDDDNLVIIKNGKRVVVMRYIDNRLSTSEAFSLLSRTAKMKFHNIKEKGKVKKLNMVSNVKETRKKKYEKLTPHACLFCGAVPEIVSQFASNSTEFSNEVRVLQCSCKGREPKYKVKWIYAVDVLDDRDYADYKLVSEWNRRMPEVKK